MAEADETPLPERQLKALRFIESFTAKNGYAPVVREVGEHLGLSDPANAKDVIKSLVRKGRIWSGAVGRRPARSLRLVGAGSNLSLPLRGKAYCGRPTKETVEDDSSRLDLREMFGREDLVAWEADGLSMVGDGVLPGPFLIVRELADAGQLRNGDKVLAMLDRSMVLKVYRRKGDTVFLESRDGQTEPIVLKGAERSLFRPLGVLYKIIVDG